MSVSNNCLKWLNLACWLESVTVDGSTHFFSLAGSGTQIFHRIVWQYVLRCAGIFNINFTANVQICWRILVYENFENQILKDLTELLPYEFGVLVFLFATQPTGRSGRLSLLYGFMDISTTGQVVDSEVNLPCEWYRLSQLKIRVDYTSMTCTRCQSSLSLVRDLTWLTFGSLSKKLSGWVLAWLSL